MCGIAGIIANDPQAVAAALKTMDCAQRHRGPDDAGDAVLKVGDRFVGLGHRRLSILDLSPAGHQPMVHPETGDQIVFNGEIYNFQQLRDELLAAGSQFVGHSDTEVMLHGLTRWGPDYVARLEGMYAFAYFNRREGKLLLARDPLGIKPLYTASTPSAFVFASEVRAVLQTGLVSREIDRDGMIGYLAYGAVPEPHTFIKGIREFPGGCWQLIDPEKLGEVNHGGPRRFWRFPRMTDEVEEPEAIEHVRERLTAAVRDHLVSDVPVGVFLSSGLDSTIVAALAARHTGQLRTFTVGFKNRAGEDTSESRLAAETAGIIGSQHTDIQVTPDDARRLAEMWFQSLDQPSIDGLNTYIISKVVRERGIVVALSGLGGDELFGGYASFSRIPRIMKMMRKMSWMPAWGRSALTNVATLRKPEAVRQKAIDMVKTRGDLLAIYLNGRRTLSDRQMASLGIEQDAENGAAGFLPMTATQDLPLSGHDVVYDISLLESRLYMGNMLLRDSDTNGMAHSLEIRVPVLDRRLIDYVYSLPGRVRLPEGRADKHLLRRAFASDLRPALLEQTKRGFTLPIGEWMKGSLRELCQDGIDHLKSQNILNPTGIDSIWQSFLSQSDDVRWSRALSLCLLGLACRKLRG